MAKRFMFCAICHHKTTLTRKESWGYTYSRRLGVVNIKSDLVISSTLNTKMEVYPNPAKNSLYAKSLKIKRVRCIIQSQTLWKGSFERNKQYEQFRNQYSILLIRCLYFQTI